jgi:serine/threonine protein phosphatase 1
MNYVIADIHGCKKTLEALLEKMHVRSNDTLIGLGDLVDRGPDSKGVLDLVMGMPNFTALKGNHEEMLLLAMDNPDECLGHWLVNGGAAVFASFDHMIEGKYIRFMESMPLIIELPEFYLCHAGIGPVPMDTPPETLLWDRTCSVNLASTGGRRLVSGHTPTHIDDIRASLGNNKICIDNGCFVRNQEGLGRLVALRLDDMKLFEQERIDTW